MSQQLNFQHFGEHAILISWPNQLSQETSIDIQTLDTKIQSQFSEKIIETVTAYASLTVYVKLNTDKDSLIESIKKSYENIEESSSFQSKTWSIPVCYDPSLGVDINKLVKEKNITVEELIQCHSEVEYCVNFLGFLPGFPYLSGLNPLLHTNRLTTPRPFVAKGSVAIGGNQTGVYPVESPGGWHIIGRTSVDFFNVNHEPICFVKPLDKIKFHSVSLDEFLHE